MKHINLEDLGFKQILNTYKFENQLDSFLVGRVILQHRERYIVLTEQGEVESELLGNLRYTAESSMDFPAVGDWVALIEYDTNKGLIHAVYPRETILVRQTVGRKGEKQIIASNLDFGLIVQSLNRDFSINRLERYLTICNSSSIKPIIIFSKVDLVDENERAKIISQVKERIKNTPLLTLSNLTGEGLDDVKSIIKTGKTYCLLGSSGVGKSSLINNITGKDLMKTNGISNSIDRGKHVTTHRELIVLETGGILIDNPGMREVGIIDSPNGLASTFEQITELKKHCKFNDCNHISTKGCAVTSALDSGELDENVYENFMKLEREQEHYTSTIFEKRQKDKIFGKMVKNVMKHKKKDRYQ
ncbi:ribosome small subunit-dependent GTPase A [Flavivirga jejuensis]|uniref:Small ribosomal subunit biogenesis GTPase RsgA n=1 Tax=Flavivirga jejuensis TaxID=870487 RepID=A0ABT8WJ46_9FLAO|nr:ribosome small subunit-dependent GTPase A [Flavivirga jejuensis]MDO5972987.1 ribosome small subunit-dependent GTPase A [Flavivirga jejuensis]